MQDGLHNIRIASADMPGVNLRDLSTWDVANSMPSAQMPLESLQPAVFKLPLELPPSQMQQVQMERNVGELGVPRMKNGTIADLWPIERLTIER